MKCLYCLDNTKNLIEHIIKKHNMSEQEYKDKYNVDFIKFKNGRMRTVSRKSEEQYPIECTVCGERFKNEKKLEFHCLREKDLLHSYIIFNKENLDEWVECKICGLRRRKLDSHIKSEHNLTVEEYWEQYNNTPIISKNFERRAREGGFRAALVVDQRVYKHLCRECKDVMIEGKNLICVSCKLKKAREKQEKKFENKVEEIDFVRCRCILENGKKCNWPDTRLTYHIKYHDYTVQQYKEEFGDIICINLRQKTAFRGKHSEETKKKMSKSHKGNIPWNTKLTKYDHPSIMKIAEKAEIRMSQLANNNWHINPLSGKRNGNFEKSTWLKGLTKETSELVENHSESNIGLFHHRSNYGNNELYNKNAFIYRYEIEQKEKVKKIDRKCIECDCKDLSKLSIHHIIPKGCFNFYELSAHSYNNLITLCDKCHSKFGQLVDQAVLKSNLDKKIFKRQFENEFFLFSKWINFANSRFVSCMPINKRFIQVLSEQERIRLSEIIFEELRVTGFPFVSYSEDELITDFENIKKSSVKFSSNILRNYNSSGYKIRDHFIRQQYLRFQELFNNDQKLMKLIRNRLGLDWKVKPEFFNINKKTFLRGFEVIYPSHRFSKYQSAVAKWVCEQFCDSNKVFDYSAGWGNRMLGVIASNRDYIGIDTNSKLVVELQNMSQWLKSKTEKSILIENVDAVDYNYGEIDFAYSCPPYGIQEKYFGMQYKTDQEWLDCFMRPVISKCYLSLKKSGKFVCHLSAKIALVIKNELKCFKEIKTIDVVNRYSHFIDKKERVNEIILICTK